MPATLGSARLSSRSAPVLPQFAGQEREHHRVTSTALEHHLRTEDTLAPESAALGYPLRGVVVRPVVSVIRFSPSAGKTQPASRRTVCVAAPRPRASGVSQ